MIGNEGLQRFGQYTAPPPNVRFDQLRKLDAFIRDYSKEVNIPYAEILIRREVLLDIVDRVYKRKVYSYVFHRGLPVPEWDEAALYCFWILKLSPLWYVNDKNHRINVSFATYMFLRLIENVCNRKNPPHVMSLTDSYIKSLVYDFKYRDMSKEAIMAIAETLLV